MPDREKVMAWLEICGENRDCSATCPYGDGSGEDEESRCRENLMADALALLKEQEKAKVVFGRCKDGSFATECGYCGMYLDKAYSICPKCKKELDWNSHQD